VNACGTKDLSAKRALVSDGASWMPGAIEAAILFHYGRSRPRDLDWRDRDREIERLDDKFHIPHPDGLAR